MASIFKTLGDAIIKRPWAFIAIWLVMLLVSIPLIGVFTSNLQYDTQEFIPDNLGSIVAQDKYDEQFPGEYKNQIVVVIESDNKTMAMRFIDDLDGRVTNDTSIANLTGTSSIYSIQRDMVVNMTPELYRTLYDAYDSASDGNHELYNATDMVLNTSHGLYWLWDNVTAVNDELYKARKQVRDAGNQLYSARDQVVMAHDGLYQVKGIADVFFGVPSVYLGAYAQAAGGGANDSVASAAAYGNTSAFIGGNYPPGMAPMAQNYLDQFNGYWAANYNADPQTRAQNTINSVAPAFINGMYGGGQIPASQRDMMLGVVSSLTLSDYGNPSRVRDFCVDTVAGMQQVADPAQKQLLYNAYDLGPGASAAGIDNLVLTMASSTMPGADRKYVEEIYYLGRNPSDGAIGNYLVDKAVTGLKDSDEGRNMSRSDLRNATDMMHDAWGLGPMAMKQDFDNYVLDKAKKGLNATERQMVDEIWGWGPSPNESVVGSYVLREAGKDLNASEKETLARLYGLGRDPGDESVRGFVVSRAMDELNLTSNATYFLALLGLDRDLSDEQLKGFARDWEATHGYDDPKVLPESVVNNLASGNVVLYMVSVSDPEESKASQDDVKAVRGHVADTLKEPQYSGVRAYVTGTTAMSEDTEFSAMDDVNNIDKVTVALVLILLALYFRSFLTPFIPLVIIGVAIAASFGFMGILSTQIEIFYLVMTFMVVIMLGAGTDYCVFMLSRYAEERSKGAEVKDAVRSTVANAGKSIASSGFTAMIGFGSLMLIDQGIFRSIGIGTATSVLFSMLVALTLVPAVLALAGDRLFWPRKLYMSGQGMTSGLWRGITSRVLKHSKAILVVALLVTVPAVYVYGQLELGDDFVSMMPNTVESKMGYDLLNDQFGSGALERGMVVATLPCDIRGPDGNYSPLALDRIESLSASLAGTSGVDKVYSLTRPEGATINYGDLSSYKAAEKEYYQSYMDDNTGLDNRTTLLYVSFVGSPFSGGAHETIDRVREKLKQYEAGGGPGTTLLLGGGSVGTYEYEKMCTDKYTFVIPAVLLGIFIVLVMLLRSLFTPARLIMTLIMSVVWTLAAFIMVFQVWLQASVFWILPIILFCVLMGLGVDYDIFLVSRIREEVFKGRTEEDAIVHAVESTGTIITLCGAVMASAFGSMMISGTMMLKEFGFVLCLAIILDATLMRLVIVPAIMVLMKKYNWWMPFVRAERVQVAAPEIRKPK